MSDSLRTDLALDALEQALYERSVGPRDGMVHDGDRGSQYLSIRYTERLAEAGIEQSVGSVGDSYDNALAESIIGLYKTEVIRPARALARPGGGGVRNPRMGRLVQPPPAPRRDREPATGRSRSGVLSSSGAHGTGRVTQANSLRIPGAVQHEILESIDVLSNFPRTSAFTMDGYVPSSSRPVKRSDPTIS